jgi:myo-inositol 2-dehydrogenase/D-chiro-inositol 1-dehydrogenase
MVAHVLRFDQSYGEAYRAVRSGRLGEIVHLAVRRNTHLGDAERLAGRVTVSFYLGVHSVDIAQWIVGSPIVEVTAISVSKVMQRFHLDDTVVSLLRFENGAIGTLENSWIRPRGASSRSIGASLVVMGTSGSLYVAPYRGTSTLYQTDYAEPNPVGYSFANAAFGKISGAYRDEFAHFVECVKEKAAPIVTPEQALSSVLVCHAIEQSLSRGSPVQIDQENVFE